MSSAENKAILIRYIEEVFNKGNLLVVDESVKTDYVVHT